MVHHLDRRAVELIDKGREVDDDVLLDTTEVARWLGVSKQFLEVGRSRGSYGPCFVKMSPSRVRYRKTDVIRWLESRTRDPARKLKRLSLPRAAKD